MSASRTIGLLGALCWTLGLGSPAAAQSVTDLESGDALIPESLANMLIGGGVTISNVTYTGAPRGLGMFVDGQAALGFDAGLILSSGKVQTRAGDTVCSAGIEGPNTCFETAGIGASANSTAFGLPGDAELDGLAGFPTLDASVLEFDFVPRFSTIQFRYVFASEEYNDFVNTEFNDVFAFYVNGVNCALVPGTDAPVSVNTINAGNPDGDPAESHPELFRDNVRPEPSIPIEMDGLTTALTCDAFVVPGEVNHMKLAIADASDEILDSAVFIDAGSFVSGTTIRTELVAGDQTGTSLEVPAGTTVTDTAELMGVNAATATGFVTYTVYSDAECTNVFAEAGTVPVSGASVPPSSPVTFDRAGTYYWVASYAGDDVNNPSEAECGSEVVTVTAPEPEVSGDCKLWYSGFIASEDPGHSKHHRTESRHSKVKGFAWSREGRVQGGHLYWSLAKRHGLRVLAKRTQTLRCTETTALLEGKAWVSHARTWVRYRIELVERDRSQGGDAYRLWLATGFDSGLQPLRFGRLAIWPLERELAQLEP